MPPHISPDGLSHTCPKCRAVYVDDCLAEVGEYLMLQTQSKVVLAAGYGAVLIIFAILGLHYHAFLRGAQTGIDINHVMIAALALLGVIIYWAFPKAGKK